MKRKTRLLALVLALCLSLSGAFAAAEEALSLIHI